MMPIYAVHRADQPCRPAAFEAPATTNWLMATAAAFGRFHELLRCIHRLDAGLHHREAHQPLVVLGGEVLHAGIGDEVVLIARSCP